MNTNTIRVSVNARWLRAIHSPLGWLVQALTGVSISFAPMFLYYAGAHHIPIYHPMVIIAGAMVYLVPLAYIAFAGPIMRQLVDYRAGRSPIEVGR